MSHKIIFCRDVRDVRWEKWFISIHASTFQDAMRFRGARFKVALLKKSMATCHFCARSLDSITAPYFCGKKTGNFGPCLRKRHHKLQLLSKGSQKKSLPKGNTFFPPMKGIWYIDPAHIFWVYISAGVIWWDAEWCASVHTMTMHIWLHFKIIQRPKLGRASPELKPKTPCSKCDGLIGPYSFPK